MTHRKVSYYNTNHKNTQVIGMGQGTSSAESQATNRRLNLLSTKIATLEKVKCLKVHEEDNKQCNLLNPKNREAYYVCIKNATKDLDKCRKETDSWHATF